jgi:hypothetical protein
MKKILALAALIFLGYGFTFTTKCKRDVCRLSKQQIVQQAANTGVNAQEETDFHPLIFISSPF